MDKETLSNYGWIVICVLVLAVMIALAGPFGNFIADAVKSTTQGLFDVNQGALDAAGIEIDNNKFPDPALNPDDGTGVYDGMIYTFGNYEYRYNYYFLDFGNDWVDNTSQNGWGVRCINNVADPGPVLESINGKYITNMTCTFWECTALTTTPTIPDKVTDMSSTFDGCTSLTTAPEIPSSVTTMIYTFMNCTSLTDLSAFVIPTSVTNMFGTFSRCTKLTTAPAIPSSVTSMSLTFEYCTSLITKPTIPSSVTTPESEIFIGCTQFGY